MWCDDFDMDLPKVIGGFYRVVGTLSEVTLYTRGSSDDEGYLIMPACWTTDRGLAAYFAALRPGEDLCESHDGPQPEEYVTDDKRVIATFGNALRVCWLHQCLFMLRRRRGYAVIWDSPMLWQHFEAIMYLRRGWGPIGENELHLHQNAVELSLVNACIAFQRLAKEEGF